MPFSARLMYHRYITCHDTEKSFRCQRLWNARVRWFETLRLSRLKAHVDRGRAPSQSRKLHAIRSVVGSCGKLINDDDGIVNSLGNHFSTKLGCRNLRLREAILDFARSSEGAVPVFDEMDVERALARFRKPLVLDRYGMCTELFRVAFESRPSEFTEWLKFVASSETCMSSLESPLLCYGKLSKDTHLKDVREVIPPCSLLKILDVILASLLSDRLSSLLPRHHDFFVGTCKFTQTRDISQGLQLVIEKGLDLKSKASIAQADIRSYYDFFPILRICCWLLKRGVERPLLLA